MTRCRVENLSDRPQILHRHFFYINTEFETGGAGIWKKKLNLGTPNGHIMSTVVPGLSTVISSISFQANQSNVDCTTQSVKCNVSSLQCGSTILNVNLRLVQRPQTCVCKLIVIYTAVICLTMLENLLFSKKWILTTK